MIISKMHWLFKERYNRNSSNYYPDFTPVQIDQFLNDASEILLQQFAEREDKQVFFDMLSPLITSQVLTPTGSSPVYEIDLGQLTKPYFYNKRIVLNTDCGNVKATVIGHGILNDVLADALQKPSKKWFRAYAVFQEGKVVLYTDHEVTSVLIEYFQVPTPVFFGGYDTLEYLECKKTDQDCTQYYSSVSAPVSSPFSPNYHARIVDVAVMEAQRGLGQQEIALTSNKINSLLN